MRRKILEVTGALIFAPVFVAYAAIDPSPVIPGRAIVRIDQGATPDLESRLYRHLSGPYKKRHTVTKLYKVAGGASVSDMVRIDFDPEKTSTIKETLAEIERLLQLGLDAEPDYEVSINSVEPDPYLPPSRGAWHQDHLDLWGFERMQVSAAWQVSKGAGQLVAVIDTGVDSTHPDLEGQVVQGMDFVHNTAGSIDDNGHGTHCAGIIAAVADNGIGIAGVAPHAKILAIKALDSGGSGSLSNVAAAIRYAADSHASIISLSLGHVILDEVPTYITEALSYAHQKGVVIVAGAGNNNIDVARFSPASDSHAIAVAAVDHEDQKAFFSNFGTLLTVAAPGGGGNTQPSDIFQPFRSILSLLSANANPVMTGNGALVVGERYLRQAGTSMATPQVAGVAALIRSLHPDYSVEQVRQALVSGSDDLGAPGFDREFGYGRLNAAKALGVSAPIGVHLSKPERTLSGPAIGAIYGTVDGPNLKEWSVDYGVGESPSAWTHVCSGSRVVREGFLCSWPLATVRDGLVTLRVVAKSSSGTEFEYHKSVTVNQVFLIDPPPTNRRQDNVEFIRSGKRLVIKGTVNPGLFSSYSLIVKSSEGQMIPANITLSRNGTEPVVNGTLGVWDTTSMPAGRYNMILVTRLTDGSQIERQATLVIDPTLVPGWPVKAFHENALSSIPFGLIQSAISADLLKDGSQELLVSYQESISVYTGSGEQLSGWPQSADPEKRGCVSPWGPVVADLDGSGGLHVIASNQCPADTKGRNSWSIFVWDAFGRLKQRWRVPSVSALSLAAADLDLDGRDDIIASSRTAIYAFHKDGSELSGWPAVLGGDLSKVAVGDVMNDGKPVVAVYDGKAVNGAHRLYLLDAHGQPLPGWPVSIPATSRGDSAPLLGDLTGDDKLEVVVELPSGGLGVYDSRGVLLPGWGPFERPLSSPVLADLNGDGKMDVVAGSGPFGDELWENYLYAYSGDGVSLPGWPACVRQKTDWYSSLVGFSMLAVADVDGDGQPDVLATSDSDQARQTLHAFDHKGRELPGFPRFTEGPGVGVDNSPVIADFTGAGHLQLAWIGRSTNIYLWDLPASSDAARPWPMYRGDAKRSGAAPRKSEKW